MKNILNVAWFSIKTTIRKKSFLISNIIILATIFIMFNIVNFLFGNYVLPSLTDGTETFTITSDIDEQDLTTLDTTTKNTGKVIKTEITQENKIPPISILDDENILGDYIKKLPSNKFIFSFIFIVMFY